MGLFVKAYNSKLPDQFEQQCVSTLRDYWFNSGTFTLSSDSPFFPARSDAKIMREDVISSVMIVQEMLARQEIRECSEIPMIVANGPFFDSNVKFSRFIEKTFGSLTHENINSDLLANNVYRYLPPLTLLDGLTNSSMSFIAQYTGLKSHNTTLGITSIASFYALKESQHICMTRDPVVLVSSNFGGSYSFLVNSAILGYRINWKESSGSACLLMTSEENGALAEITHLISDGKVPDLFENKLSRNWKALLPGKPADAIFFSGAYDEKTYQDDLEYCRIINKNAFSLFEDYGNMGPTNVLTGVIEGIKRFSAQFQVIDIVDRDVYGRESLLRIKIC